MIEQEIEIPMAAGTADGVLFRPEGERRSPGVLHLTDAGGIRSAHRDMARRLAGHGYTVLMPNIFYRTRRPPVLNVKAEAGSEEMRRQVAELAAPLTPEAIESDAADYVNSLGQEDGGIGVVGYCLSGGIALRIAAALPGRITAMASFHGGGLCTDAPASPHLVLPRVRARLYFGHAVQDRSMPKEAIEKLDHALKAWGGQYESEIYEDAFHSWTVPDSPVFHRSQAERAFEKLTALFAESLRHF